MPMRVLHLAAGNLYGGIEALLMTLARLRHLTPKMDPYFAICFGGRLEEELRGCGAMVHQLGAVRLSRPWTVWAARRRLQRLLLDLNCEIAIHHGCWLHVVFAPTVRSAHVAPVFWAHGVHTGRTWLERWAGWTPPALVIANSHATRAAVTSVFSNVPSELLYLPVAPPASFDHNCERWQLRSLLRTPMDATVIVLASRLEKLKGHTVLLEALAHLYNLPGWVCWIAGGAQRPQEKEYLDGLLTQAAQLGLTERVRFLGQRSDVPALLATADILCQPNVGPEGFGLTFLEALYAGLPVVSTALGSALEIIDDSCGILVPQGNAVALAVALRELIQDPERRRRLGAAGPERAGLLCDPVRQMRRLEQILAAVSSDFRRESASLNPSAEVVMNDRSEKALEEMA